MSFWKQEKKQTLKYEIKDNVSQATKTNWTEQIPNNINDISKFVIKCIRNTFDVDGVHDNEFKRSSVFNDIVNDIYIFNKRMDSDKAILIPSEYKNELTIAYPIIKDLS